MSLQRRQHTRRRILHGCGVISTVAVAGCLSGSSDDGETDDEAGNSESGQSEQNPHREYISAFESYLEDENVDFSELEVNEDETSVKLSYKSDYLHDEFALADEIGHITGGYMQQLEEDWEMPRLDATISDEDGEVATWYMESEWFFEMEDGERTPEELSLEVLETLDLTV